MKNNARSKNLPKNNSGLFLFDKNNFFMGGIIQVPFAKITIYLGTSKHFLIMRLFLQINNRINTFLQFLVAVFVLNP